MADVVYSMCMYMIKSNDFFRRPPEAHPLATPLRGLWNREKVAR